MKPVFSEKAVPKTKPKTEVDSKLKETSTPASGLRKLTKNVSSPSIKDALSGNMESNIVSAKEQHEIYTNNKDTENFSESEFVEKWNLFLASVDSPNLRSTMSSIPEFNPAYKFILKIENTVQEENIKSIKPELITFLRKELKNSSIEIATEIVENTGKKLIYSDDDKYHEMAKKNPDLALLRQKFNLDFGD